MSDDCCAIDHAQQVPVLAQVIWPRRQEPHFARATGPHEVGTSVIEVSQHVAGWLPARRLQGRSLQHERAEPLGIDCDELPQGAWDAHAAAVQPGPP